MNYETEKACEAQRYHLLQDRAKTVKEQSYGVQAGNSAASAPASEICADLHTLIEAQSRAIRHAEGLAIKIFGPVPELDNAKIPYEPSHLSALIAHSRHQAEEIANRLEGLNANI